MSVLHASLALSHQRRKNVDQFSKNYKAKFYFQTSITRCCSVVAALKFMHRFFVIELISVTTSTVVRCCCFRRWDMGDGNGTEEVKCGTEKNAYLSAALCLIKLHKKEIDSGNLHNHCIYHKVTLSNKLNR